MGPFDQTPAFRFIHDGLFHGSTEAHVSYHIGVILCVPSTLSGIRCIRRECRPKLRLRRDLATDHFDGP